MSRTTAAVVGAVAALIVLFVIPSIIFKLIIIGAIAVPVVGYLMLDPSQRRRLRGQARKRLGS